MTVQVEIVLPGTKVRYHGSIAYHHGEMEVIDFGYPRNQINGDDVIRYQLKYGTKFSQYLTNVRPGSFTVIEE